MEEEIKVYSFCPCFKDFEGELLCLNNDDLIDIEHSPIATEILSQEPTAGGIQRFEVGDGCTCYASIYTHDGYVYCVSQGWKIRIHEEDITADMLRQAIRLYTLGPIEITIDCASCIYGILFALVISQDQASVKRYLDEFSLKIAMKFSELEIKEIDENTPYFETIQEYLVDLLEDQHFWEEIYTKFKKEEHPEELLILANMMEQLDRYQFLFYSQVLNIRSISNSRILMKMLSHILQTSRRILNLNKSIRNMMTSELFKGFEEDDQLDQRIEDYLHKSKTIDHFFGNITDIMKGTTQ